MVRVLPKRELVLFITILTLFISNASFLFAGQYQVFRVVDGDTFVLKHGSANLTIRMVGIDAPEASTSKHRAGQPFSRQATQHLSVLILNKTVDVKSYGADQNGRTLGDRNPASWQFSHREAWVSELLKHELNPTSKEPRLPFGFAEGTGFKTVP
jgi:endonuclease YncB( thermonuclease family)